MEKMLQPSYNRSAMAADFYYDDILDITKPRRQKWSGAEITSFIDDIHQTYEFASQLKVKRGVKDTYRELLTELIRTYGH